MRARADDPRPTQPLPAGNYLVTAIAGLAIYPVGQVVCAVSTLTCNSFSFGKGTYAHGAAIEAVPAAVHR